jgi:hypothetical protein
MMNISSVGEIDHTDLSVCTIEEVVAFANKHTKELLQILSTGKCLCGADLDKDNTLYDRGFDVGLECENCK